MKKSLNKSILIGLLFISTITTVIQPYQYTVSTLPNGAKSRLITLTAGDLLALGTGALTLIHAAGWASSLIKGTSDLKKISHESRQLAPWLALLITGITALKWQEKQPQSTK